MKKYIFTFLLLSFLNITFAQKPEKNVSADFNFESKFMEIKGNQVHYIEKGKGEVILFLHGIPTWSYLWRNVLPKVASDNKRAIALDFLGYGKSDYPENHAVTFQDQYDMLDAFVAQLGVEKVTLVVNDLGSMLGLAWAGKNQAKVKGIVIIEGVFMPSVPWYKQITGLQKMMVGMMKKEKRAERFLVKKNIGAKKMPKMFTQRKLSKEEKQMYVKPFEDKNRRYVMVYGPGPANFVHKKGSQKKGDFNDIMDTYAQELAASNLPIHLIYAKKGLIVRKEAVEYAQNTFKSYSETFIGKGKHFLPESHPKAIAKAINDWYTKLDTKESKK